MQSVMLHQGTTAWKPEQWMTLLDAMIEADTAISDSDPTVSAGAGPSGPGSHGGPGGSGGGPSAPDGQGGPGGHGGPGGPGSSRGSGGSSGGHSRGRKRTRQGPGPSAGPSAGPSTRTLGGSAPGPETETPTDRFRRLRWPTQEIADAAARGDCIKCLRPGHFARDCPMAGPLPKRVLPTSSKGKHQRT